MSRSAFNWSSTALLAPLLSIVTVLETSLCCIAFGGQHEIDGFALLVHDAIEVFPRAFHLDICFIHMPAFTDGVLAISKGLFQQRQKLDCPAVDRRVIYSQAPLQPHFFKVPVTQGTGRILANANQNDIYRKLHPFGSQHGCLLIIIQNQKLTARRFRNWLTAMPKVKWRKFHINAHYRYFGS